MLLHHHHDHHDHNFSHALHIAERALILLAVIGVVAAAKYFEVNGFGAEAHCEHQRNLIVRQILARDAAEHFNNSTLDAGDMRVTLLHACPKGLAIDRFGTMCWGSCPDNGAYSVYYSVRKDGTPDVRVYCDRHCRKDPVARSLFND